MAKVKDYYGYDPSTPIAIVAAVLYGLSLIISLFQTIRTRAWLWLVMALAVGMEFVGFLFRIKSTNNTSDKNLYIVQFCLIILAPVLMAGAIYVIFGRTVFHVVPVHARTLRLLWIPPRFITPIFVGFDVVALLLQAVGAVTLTATDPTDTNAGKKLNRGKDLAMAGIAVQLVAFGLFTVIAARFQFTSKRFIHDVEKKLQMEPGEKEATVSGSDRKIKPTWQRILFAVNFSCGLILLRSVFRMTEFSEGKTGEINSHEWFMYVFDVIPMLFVCVIFNIAPPGTYLPFMGFRLPKSERRLPSSDGEAQHVELQPSSTQPLYPQSRY